MAETPFSPESGAASDDAAAVGGTQDMPGQPLEPLNREPAPMSSGEPVAVLPDPETAAAAPAEPAPLLSSQPEAAAPTAGPAAAEPAAQPPGVAATIAVPPLEQGETGGGEWELLVERISAWWTSGELNRQWQRIRGPLKGVAILVAVLLALQVYATAVRTIDGIPLVSGLLELTGLVAVLQFSVRRLLRSGDRQEVLAQLQRRWLDFQGRS